MTPTLQDIGVREILVVSLLIWMAWDLMTRTIPLRSVLGTAAAFWIWILWRGVDVNPLSVALGMGLAAALVWVIDLPGGDRSALICVGMVAGPYVMIAAMIAIAATLLAILYTYGRHRSIIGIPAFPIIAVHVIAAWELGRLLRW